MNKVEATKKSLFFVSSFIRCWETGWTKQPWLRNRFWTFGTDCTTPGLWRYCMVSRPFIKLMLETCVYSQYFTECDPFGAPAWPEDDGSETEQLAGGHPGLEGRRLVSTGEHWDSAVCKLTCAAAPPAVWGRGFTCVLLSWSDTPSSRAIKAI